tara:strand:- start:6074 stop:6559 length:486 start_codon:yes stop_codon:yes gene_type:complete
LKEKDYLKNKIYFAIDPGYSGAIAICKEGHWQTEYCPKNTKDIFDIIKTLKNDAWVEDFNLKGVIEKVWAFPTDARASAFKFGYNYGAWKTSLNANRIDYHEITPQVWMRIYDLPKEKKDRKNTLKDLSAKIAPDIRITLKNADAVALCDWLIKEEHNESK